MFSKLILPLLAITSAALAQDQSSNTTTTCYWPNGSAAPPSLLLPCPNSLSDDGFVACCPPSTASDLFPLDYPLCTANGLCKAGNSNFLARGGCTDSNWSSESCPGYCPSKTQTGMAGLTNCNADSYWWCCNDQHDDGACNCNPPNGTAFLLSGTEGVKYQDFVKGNGLGPAGNGSAQASSSAAAGSGTSTSAGGMSTAAAAANASSTGNSSSVSVVYQTVQPSASGTPGTSASSGGAAASGPSGSGAAASTPSSGAAVMGQNLAAVAGAVVMGVALAI